MLCVNVIEANNESSFIAYENFEPYLKEWHASRPFRNLVLSDFLDSGIAKKVAGEFPPYDSSLWKVYNNRLEEKRAINDWDKFGATTYQLFQFLNSPHFVRKLEALVNETLIPDYGLNGGGLHSHKQGSKSNVHLDYSIHPRLQLERRLNLLIYLTPGWVSDWGGALGFWEQNAEQDGPGKLIRSIDPIFNTAVLFDPTQNSWHGLPEPIQCPDGVYRNSLAVYYLCMPRVGANLRGKALFAPYGDQARDPEILDLIRRRADVAQSKTVYGD